MSHLIYLDTETTDLGACRIVELSLAVVPTFGGNPVIETFRCKPPVPISFDAMAVHHITEEDVAGLPAFDKLPDYQRILDTIETGLVIAHNAPFDIGVLEREGIKVGPHIDTQVLAKALLPEAKRHTLQFLRYYLGVRLPSAVAHSADGDVRVLIGVFEKLAQRLAQEHALDSDEAVIEQARLISKGSR